MIMLTPALKHSRKEIYDWLTLQAKKLHIEASLLTHEARMYEGSLYLPVYIANSIDVYDDVAKLQKLEDTWNLEGGKSEPRIFLVPSDKKPEWLEARAPMQQAIDQYYEAFDAFVAARSAEAADVALEAMKNAKIAEFQAERSLDRAA
jgi:hypothetical protein